MQVVDKGHCYLVDSYDGGPQQQVRFMKRLGDKYPGNLDAYWGTNCQELLRVLIDRVKYLDGQAHCFHNWLCIRLLRTTLYLFEHRAAKRHNRKLHLGRWTIESHPACKICGHIQCDRHPQQRIIV